MKIKKEDIGYVALLTCILNEEFVMKEDVMPAKIRKNKREFNIDKDLKDFIGNVVFV